MLNSYNKLLKTWIYPGIVIVNFVNVSASISDINCLHIAQKALIYENQFPGTTYHLRWYDK